MAIFKVKIPLLAFERKYLTDKWEWNKDVPEDQQTPVKMAVSAR